MTRSLHDLAPAIIEIISMHSRDPKPAGVRIRQLTANAIRFLSELETAVRAWRSAIRRSLLTLTMAFLPLLNPHFCCVPVLAPLHWNGLASVCRLALNGTTLFKERVTDLAHGFSQEIAPLGPSMIRSTKLSPPLRPAPAN
jgi:hypothetical protein